MQHNWNVNTVMKCLKVFLRWRLDVTQTRCVNAVVQNKAFVYSSNLISSTPYWMFENAWLKSGCHCGPCPSLLSGHLTAQRRLWSWRRQKLSSSPCPPARSLSCWEACHLFAAPASRCSTELLSSQWGLAGALHSGNVAGILFSSRWWLFLHLAGGAPCYIGLKCAVLMAFQWKWSHSEQLSHKQRWCLFYLFPVTLLVLLEKDGLGHGVTWGYS